jgi:hypothetical protein
MEYTRVKRSHIVPCGYLVNFAADGMLALRLDGALAERPISVRDAAVRTDFYRRERPDGTKIDDIEWSLSELENATSPILRDIANRWPLVHEDKMKLATLFGVQLVRGPRWKEWHEEETRKFFAEQRRSRTVAAETTTEEVLNTTERHLLGSTARTIRMLGLAPKVATVVSSMHWALIEFRSPLLATSDDPVAVWPLAEWARRPAAAPMNTGLLRTLEIRVPVSSNFAVLMSWLYDEDTRELIPGTRQHAANLNAFTVAQAGRQAFHKPGTAPPIASGRLLPIAPQLLPGLARMLPSGLRGGCKRQSGSSQGSARTT